MFQDFAKRVLRLGQRLRHPPVLPVIAPFHHHLRYDYHCVARVAKSLSLVLFGSQGSFKRDIPDRSVLLPTTETWRTLLNTPRDARLGINSTRLAKAMR